MEVAHGGVGGSGWCGTTATGQVGRRWEIPQVGQRSSRTVMLARRRATRQMVNVKETEEGDGYNMWGQFVSEGRGLSRPGL